MAVVPDIIEGSLPSADLPGVMQAIYDHITNTSTRFSIANDGGSQTAYTIESDALGFQVNLRIDTNDSAIKGAFSRGGSITDPGDNSTLPSPIVSGESWFIEDGHVSDTLFYLCELDDMIYVIVTDSSDNETMDGGFFAGALYIPFWPSLSSGWGVMGGNGFTPFYPYDDWRNKIHIQGDSWADMNGLDSLDAYWSNPGVLPVPSRVRASGSGNYGGRRVGISKYIVNTNSSDYSKGTIIQGPDGTSFMNYDDDNEFVIWNDSIIPAFSD